eukprot:403369006
MKYEESMKHKMMYRSHKSCIVTSKQFATEENFIELAKIHGKSFTQQSSQNYSDSKYILEKSSPSEEFFLNPYLGQNKRGRPKKKLIVKPVLRKYSAISSHPPANLHNSNEDQIATFSSANNMDFSKIPNYFYR